MHSAPSTDNSAKMKPEVIHFYNKKVGSEVAVFVNADRRSKFTFICYIIEYFTQKKNNFGADEFLFNTNILYILYLCFMHTNY